jgi:hypothetical protein
MTDPHDMLRNAGRLEERPFHSEAPLLGPVIVWFRARWNNIAARWFVLPFVEQQRQFNDLVAAQLAELEEQLVAQDRRQTELIQELARLTARLTALKGVERNEAGSPENGPE